MTRCFIISAVTDGIGGKKFYQFIISTKDSPRTVIDKFVSATKDTGRDVVGDVMCTELMKEEIAGIYKEFFTDKIQYKDGNVLHVDFKK